MAEAGEITRGFQEEHHNPSSPPPPSSSSPPPPLPLSSSPPPPPPPPPPPQHANVVQPALIFSMMVSLLQLKYQGSDTSPFETHLPEMILSVVSFFISVFSHDALQNITPDSNYYYKKTVEFLACVFVPLTAASYLSLLFPSVRPILYTMSILYSAIQLLYTTLTQRLKCLYHKFMNISRDTYTTSQNQLTV